MSLAYTGSLGKGIVEVHRPNDIRDEPARFDFILRSFGEPRSESMVVHLEPSMNEVLELMAALALLTMTMKQQSKEVE